MHIKVPYYREEDVKWLPLEGMEGVDPTPLVRVAGLTFRLIVLRIVCYVRRNNVTVKDIHSEKNECTKYDRQCRN
jgi:hypothetical protein